MLLRLLMGMMLSLSPEVEAIEGREARLQLRDGGGVVVGTVLSVGDGYVALTEADGNVIEVDAQEIESFDVLPELPPPQLPKPTCLSHRVCEGPRRCIRAGCRVDASKVDELERDGRRRHRGGRKAMIAGGVVAGVGAIMLAVGLGGDYGTPPAGRDKDWARAMWGAGTALLAGGVMTLGFGGIVRHVGINNEREAKQHRRKLELDATGSPTSAALNLRGRF